MSVAFRRESDDEHLEPRFELPIPPGPNLVTPRGLVLIAARVATLEAALDAAADEDARKAVARDLRYWRTRHATAEPVAVPADGEAGIGTTVRFRLDGETRQVTIVGHDEADPDARLIAFSSPLGRALMGAAAGDLVAFRDDEDAIEVLGVEICTTPPSA